jgi:hypothetical protein
MNYMNVLSDFEIRVNRCLPDTNEQIQISRLDTMLHEKDRIIEKQAAEISTLSRKKIEDEMEPDLAGDDPGASLKNLAHLLMKSSSSKKEKTVKKQVIKPSSGKPVKKKSAAKKTTKTVKKAKK